MWRFQIILKLVTKIKYQYYSLLRNMGKWHPYLNSLLKGMVLGLGNISHWFSFFFPEWCEKCLKTKKIRISVSFIIKSKANSCPKLQQQHKLLPFPWRHLRLWALPVNKLVAAAAAKDDKTIPEKGSHVTSVKQFGLAKFHVEQAAVQCRTIDCKNGQADGFQKRSHHKSRSPWWLVVA